ncbi:MAG: cation:proton antiporter [Pseudomonadota bacterium]
MAAEFSPADLLKPTVAILGVGAAAAIASRAIKVSPIVGYLIAGVIIGPHALNAVQESDLTHLLAELGVVFLLFDIGMHISMRELKESRGDLLGLAPAHLVMNALAFTLILGGVGVAWPVAIAIGVSLALSSTAVVARLLSDRGLNSCPLGRSATHVLIFQDIVAIFLLIFASALGGDPSSIPLTMAIAAGQAIIAFGAALLVGRYLVGPGFRLLAGTQNAEAFTAVTLLMVLGAALATYAIGLSLTLGAFLAGLAVSGTAYRHQIQTESGPFRGLLLSFFFINVGMLIDVPALIANLPLVLGVAAGIILIKTAAGYFAARVNKWTAPGGTQLAFLLAQGSEFTLVVLSILGMASATLVAAGGAPLMDPLVETVIVAAVAISLAAAPFWADAGMRLSRKLAERLRKSSEQAAPDVSTSGARPVLVFGMTETGRLAVDALNELDLPYIALDNDPERFLAATADGYTVAFGDAANLRLIDAIGASRARALVIGQPRYSVSAQITPIVRERFADMKRFVALEDESDVARFESLGIRAFHVMADPPGIEMVADLLRELDVDDERIIEWMQAEADRFDLEDMSVEVIETIDESAQAA